MSYYSSTTGKKTQTGREWQAEYDQAQLLRAAAHELQEYRRETQTASDDVYDARDTYRKYASITVYLISLFMFVGVFIKIGAPSIFILAGLALPVLVVKFVRKFIEARTSTIQGETVWYILTMFACVILFFCML